jgi:hypothetical protein
MPMTVVDFEEKKYIIADAEFKLRKPTLGIKRRGTILGSTLSLKNYELSVSLNNYRKKLIETDKDDLSAVNELIKTAEQINKMTEDVFIKAEEFLKLILEPVKAGDESKLIADNIDADITQGVIQDFFQLAGLSLKPASS